MGLLDRLRGKTNQQAELPTGHPSTLQTFEEKTGMQIVIMNEAKKEKMTLLQMYINAVRDLEKQYDLHDSEQYTQYCREKLLLIRELVDSIATPYGRGGDNPKFQKLYTLFSRLYATAEYLPSLVPIVDHAARILISSSQFDKDVAVNTPVIIKKEYPELPQFNMPTINPSEKRITLPGTGGEEE